MNQLFLEEPRTHKELDHGESFGFASMQGWRSSSEDFHKHLIPFDHHAWKLWCFFSIFDGHCGTDTASNAARLLHGHLLNSLNSMLKEDHDKSAEHDISVRSSQLNLEHFRSAIKNTYYELDKDLRQIVKDHSGSTCVTALVGPEKIYLINIGDSRAIIFSADGQILAVTQDHKPNLPGEKKRIKEAGGKIFKLAHNDVLRVEGQLALTRALGDFALNKDVVPPMADIFDCSRKSAAFIVLACDGIWDVMSNEEVATIVCKRTATTTSKLDTIAAEILDECLKRESSDNMTIYIIKLCK